MISGTSVTSGGVRLQGVSGGSERRPSLDLLRLLATVQMVQGHTLDALLADSRRAGPLFEVWTWTRGLTAPAFLVAAGLAFHLTTLERWGAYRASPVAQRRRVRRYFMLVGIGYLLHVPLVPLLRGEAWDDPVAWLAAGSIVDVLQCIGVTLLALEGGARVARSPTVVVAGAAVGALLLLWITPYCAGVEASEGWAPLQNYITSGGGSLFPLVPWAAYVGMGVVTGALIRRTGPGLRGASGLAVGAAGLVGLGACLDDSGAALVVSRSGFVLLVLAVLVGVDGLRPRVPRWLVWVAGASLPIYVVHILALYADGVGLHSLVGHALSWRGAIAAALLVLGGSVALAWVGRAGAGWRVGRWPGRESR